MRILILNWRDITNPRAGGAEQLTQEMAKRWVRDGHIVTQISARWNGCKPREIMDGVTIIRFGRWWIVHAYALFYYLFRLRKTTDIIIDEVHWFPYFAKLYAPEKTVLLACEVANMRLFELYSYPVAFFWRILERWYLWIYRGVPAMAISPSTKDELVEYGFSAKNITVLPMGVTVPDYARPQSKESRPTVLFLGRLNALKGAADALEAFRKIRMRVHGVRMWFVGTGNAAYVRMLKDRAGMYGLDSSVSFYGHVSEAQKFDLLARAHILMVPSVHEGWGLVVSEAAYVGTPAVVYNVAGLRDVVNHGETGLVVEPTVSALANGVITLLTDKEQYTSMQKKAIENAQSLSWEETAQVGIDMMQQCDKVNFGRFAKTQ